MLSYLYPVPQIIQGWRIVLKASKTLGLIIAAVQLVGVAAFALGVHTMIGVSGSAFPQGEQQIQPQPGDPVVIPFTLHPRNEGFLEAKLTVSLSIVVDGGNVLATDSATVTLPPGGTQPVELELRIPLAQFQQHMGSQDVSWVADVKVTTLFDLISFSNTMTVTGGT